jgi:hypothetical protein
MHPLSNVRTQGVRIPENQSTESAPTMKITNIAVGKVLLVEYGNERGIKETTLGFLFGARVFVPPQHLIFTAGFRPLVEELNKQVVAYLETKEAVATATVPSDDTVDVVTLSGPPPTEGGFVDVFEKPAKVK